jgi:hypothetical protein
MYLLFLAVWLDHYNNPISAFIVTVSLFHIRNFFPIIGVLLITSY